MRRSGPETDKSGPFRHTLRLSFADADGLKPPGSLENDMRGMWLIVLLVALAMLSSVPSGADPSSADDKSGRYTMSPTQDGVVRLDTQTGAMALCQRKNDAWACVDMDDSQRALLAEIDKLKAENKSLRDEVEHLDESLGLNDSTAPSSPQAQITLPNEKDVDKAFDYFERMLDKLQERMDKLKEKHSRKPETEL
jgi:hypothetical protein